MKVCPTCKAEYAGGELFCPVDASRLSTPSEMDQAAPTAQDPLIGTTLGGRYQIVSRLGEGGMGIVYEAQHVVIEKRVALKVLRDDFSSRPDVVERFRQEAKSASRIGHQHIVDISDFGETPAGASYFVMEYLKGEDLANVLARERTLAPGRTAHIAVQCCRALGAAHAKGIVHRDMKPENIFLVQRDDADDFVKIVDFGIAKMSDIETSGEPGRKLTKTGMIFGTPEYMSAEQAAGKELDHRVDIYALGAILFEMLTGRVPFVGDSFMRILTQHMFEPVPAMREINPGLDVSADLEAVVGKALAKEPDERYQTMDELAHDLQAAMGWAKGESTLPGVGQASRVSVVGQGTGQAQPVGPRAVTGEMSTDDMDLPRPRSKRLGLVAAASAALVGVMAVGGWLAFGSDTSSANGSAEADAPNGEDQDVPRAAAPPADKSDTEAGSKGGDSDPDEGNAEPSAVAETKGAEADTDSADDSAGGDDAPKTASAEKTDEMKAGAPTPIELRIETHPSGARVAVAGRGAVCDETPCSFTTTPGEEVRLRASRGRARAMRTVTPNEGTTIEMRLRRPKRGSGGNKGGGKSPQAGDLKVPEIFR